MLKVEINQKCAAIGTVRRGYSVHKNNENHAEHRRSGARPFLFFERRQLIRKLKPSYGVVGPRCVSGKCHGTPGHDDRRSSSSSCIGSCSDHHRRMLLDAPDADNAEHGQVDAGCVASVLQ